MGSVALPTAGLICVDANVVIYSVKKHPRYSLLLRPLWAAETAGQARVLVSELALLETLVAPYRANDQELAANYEDFLLLPGIEPAPITSAVLRSAARLRSQLPRLRSPDAIHAATALERGVGSFVTNDVGFRTIPGLNVVVLDDVIAPPAAP